MLLLVVVVVACCYFLALSRDLAALNDPIRAAAIVWLKCLCRSCLSVVSHSDCLEALPVEEELLKTRKDAGG